MLNFAKERINIWELKEMSAVDKMQRKEWRVKLKFIEMRMVNNISSNKEDFK